MSIVTAVLIAAGCSGAGSLAGEYSEKEGGPAIAKLESSGGEYKLSVGSEGKWENSVPMREATEPELRNLFKSDYDKLHPVGFCGKDGGFPVLVKVDQGAQAGGRTMKSGTFLALNWLMSGDVYKK